MKEEEFAGITVQSFTSLEEFFEQQESNEEEAIAGALPEQWDIGWGDYAIRFLPELVIYGHVESVEEILAASDFDEAQGVHEDELLSELEMLRGSHERGYRYGKWYSTVEPTGEWGSAHVVTLWKITEGEFLSAQLRGWDPQLNTDTVARVVGEILTATRAKVQEGEVHIDEGEES